METSPSTAAQPPRFITIPAAAKILKVSDRLLYGLIRKNLGPRVIRVGARIKRIPYDEFLQWCEKPLTQARPRRKQRKIAP